MADTLFHESHPPPLPLLTVSGSTHAADKKLAKLRCLVHHAIRRHEGYQGVAMQAPAGRSFATFFPQQMN